MLTVFFLLWLFFLFFFARWRILGKGEYARGGVQGDGNRPQPSLHRCPRHRHLLWRRANQKRGLWEIYELQDHWMSKYKEEQHAKSIIVVLWRKCSEASTDSQAAGLEHIWTFGNFSICIGLLKYTTFCILEYYTQTQNYVNTRGSSQKRWLAHKSVIMCRIKMCVLMFRSLFMKSTYSVFRHVAFEYVVKLRISELSL